MPSLIEKCVSPVWRDHLSQGWDINDWTRQIIFQWNLNQTYNFHSNSNFHSQKWTLNIICKMPAILSHYKCIDASYDEAWKNCQFWEVTRFESLKLYWVTTKWKKVSNQCLYIIQTYINGVGITWHESGKGNHLGGSLRCRFIIFTREIPFSLHWYILNIVLKYCI